MNEATERFETQNVSLTVKSRSDKPIVRLPKKFQLSGSWRKFARLGYLGTSGVSSSGEGNVTTCSSGERVRSLALAENILYLKGGSHHVFLRYVIRNIHGYINRYSLIEIVGRQTISAGIGCPGGLYKDSMLTRQYMHLIRYWSDDLINTFFYSDKVLKL